MWVKVSPKGAGTLNVAFSTEVSRLGGLFTNFVGMCTKGETLVSISDGKPTCSCLPPASAASGVCTLPTASCTPPQTFMGNDPKTGQAICKTIVCTDHQQTLGPALDSLAATPQQAAGIYNGTVWSNYALSMDCSANQGWLNSLSAPAGVSCTCHNIPAYYQANLNPKSGQSACLLTCSLNYRCCYAQ